MTQWELRARARLHTAAKISEEITQCEYGLASEMAAQPPNPRAVKDWSVRLAILRKLLREKQQPELVL